MVYGLASVSAFILISLYLLNSKCVPDYSLGGFGRTTCQNYTIFVLVNFFGVIITKLIFPGGQPVYENILYILLATSLNIPIFYLLGVLLGKLFNKIFRRKKGFFFSILILLFVFSLNSVTAEIDTTVNLVTINQQNDFQLISENDLTLTYVFNTGEVITKNIESGTKNSVDLVEKLFCYEDCNIMPNRVVIQTDIVKDDELLSRQGIPIPSNNQSQILNVYLLKKIDSQISKDVPLTDDDINNNPYVNSNEIIVTWNGSLVINDASNYEFYIKNSGGVKIYVDNNLVLENLDNNINNEYRNFSIDLNSGIHIITLFYWTDQSESLNLLWKKNHQDKMLIIPKDNLIFSNGNIEKKKSNQKLLSASSFPISYTINYQTYPTAVLGFVPPITTNVPVLLIHGLHGSDKINPSDTSTWTYWNNITFQLSGLNNDVWEVFYTPANVSNFMTAGLLRNEINTVLSLYSHSKIDVVSHSMGGLVTLGYIYGLGKTSVNTSITYGNNIRNLVMIGGPIHGSYSANGVLLKKTPTIA